MRYLKFIISIIIIMLVFILVVENLEAFSTKVFFKIDLFSLHYKSADIAMYYIVPIAFLFGIIIAGLYGIIERFQLKKQIKNLVKASKEKDKELNSLRNLPITSDGVSSGNLNGSERDT